ncbi:White-opaque regulator 1-like protein 2 [Pleurostoma richardsiae]|uniref:White-opaque regulator 1-like protein 2 n=1 Tax=Pleurostoma richardsiae TaxID=41990 RepID=A0AA38VVE0_9PEZI|nr:White-opaque regulator 1-like protein 2 [Pleurostoma richardsiae]
MVYCGKASQGCQSCRTRRIKCDKARPECSQCVRVSKKCPGYRDQLSLMFRDESSKVMRKAHAQWGVESTADLQADAASPSSHRSSSISVEAQSSSSSVVSHSPVFIPFSPTSADPTSTVALPSPAPINTLVSMPLYPRPSTSPIERGIQFYLDRYLLRYPDEPRTVEDVSQKHWFHEPALQTVMAAVGLAGISNLTGNEEMRVVAGQQYGKALQSTAQVIRDRANDAIIVAVRSVVMLALFEVVNETHETTEVVKKHILGAGALIQSGMPFNNTPHGGARGLISLCCSLFIPCLVSGIPLPGVFFDWLSTGNKIQIPEERPAADLALIMTKWVQLSAYIRQHAFSDGRPKTAESIKALLKIDAQLEQWASQLPPSWHFQTVEGKGYPPAAVFHGRYHRYRNVYTARMWSHYRWARILVNQMILECVERYPMSSLPLVSFPRQERILEVIRQTGEDVLISTPTHYRDPRLSREQLDEVQTAGGPGAGAVGIPALLFHLKVASCAPGAPYEYWEWSLGMMDTIWCEMGMLHARSLAEVMRAHKASLESEIAEGLLKVEISS